MLSVLGLALLLLLSPCKVKNFIQAELGVPQTKVLNKSQTTLSQSICLGVEVSELVEVTARPDFKHHYFPISGTFFIELPNNSLHHAISPGQSRNHPVPEVPLYILYQNLKVYS